MKIDFDTYIIAGGNSTRMGSDKATFKIAETTFLTSIYQVTKKLCPTTFLVSDHEKHKYLGLPILKDTISKIGPIGGVLTALQHTSKKNTLILSCDLPLINHKILSYFIDKSDDTYNASIAIVNNRINPLIGIYNKNISKLIVEQINEKNYKMMEVLKKAKIKYIIIPKNLSIYFKNVNTPEDLKEIQKWI